MPFSFRLRVRMATAPLFEGEPIVLTFPRFSEVSVSYERDDARLGKWVIFTAGGYFDEAGAISAGQQFSNALVLAGAIGRVGVDMGYNRSTLRFSKQVHEAVKEIDGAELRAEVHGLTTFEEGAVQFISMSATATVSSPTGALNGMIAVWLDLGIILTERQRNCAALLNDSFFVQNIEGQFVLRVSAVESLCEQTDVGSEYLTVLDAISEFVKCQVIEPTERETVDRMLVNARRASIRQAYMRKIRAALGDECARRFDQLYKKRGALVHEGRGRGELLLASTEVFDLAVKLLEKDVLHARGDGVRTLAADRTISY